MTLLSFLRVFKLFSHIDESTQRPAKKHICSLLSTSLPQFLPVYILQRCTLSFQKKKLTTRNSSCRAKCSFLKCFLSYIYTVYFADTYKLDISFCSSSLWTHARSPPIALQKSLAPNHVCIFSLPLWKICEKWTVKYSLRY